MRTLACLVAPLLLAAAPAPEAGVRLAVVSLKAGPRLTFTGKEVADTIAQSAHKVGGFEVLGPAEVEERLGRSGMQKLVDCGDDSRCLAAASAPLHVERVVGGVVSRTATDYRVTVVHADVKTGARVASFEREIPVASRRLLSDVSAATPALLHGEAEASGMLTVLTDAPGAEVAVDGQPAGKTPLAVSLKPGKHRVKVSRTGYIEQDPHWVEVPANGVAEDRVRLYPIARHGAGETQVEVSH